MKPTSLLKKYKKKEKARVKAGFKAKNGEDKLSRFLANYTYSENDKNEMEFFRFIKDLKKRGLIKDIETKVFKNKAMMSFDSKNSFIQSLIEKKKQELGIFNNIIRI